MPPKLSSPEAPFENRFFSVIIKDGKAVMTDTTQIAAINGEEAEKLALSALESGVQSGWSGDYRYAVQALDDKGTLVVFLDCGRNLASSRSYMRTSALLYVCALAAVFALLALLSGRVVKPISESYEKQRRFVADAGHDIKTPITIIDADAEVLQMELGDNEWVSDIKAQTGRLAVLIATLMELSRMEQPISRRQMIEFPLSDIAAETAQSFQAKAKLQNKTLIINAEPMLSFYGDENALRQLVSILCDNAVKYSPKDSEIRLTLEKKPRSVELTVKNACETITKEQLSRLFDRFYRADASRAGDGYGIGLSIAKAIVVAHKGKIQARTADGKSLTVTAAMPTARTQRL